jgi:DNA topoisomerase-3
VFEHGMSYVCENSVANPKTCDFRSGKVILQQEIAREQMAKLLEEGRTDLLTNFKSSRTGRNFKAFLVKQNDGKIGFEFEKKEPSAKTAAKTAAAKAAAKAAPESDDEDASVAVKAVPATKKVAAKKAPATKAAATKTAAAKKAPAKKTAARKTGS